MQKRIAGFRNIIISGILFLLPVFVVAYLVQKIWKGLTGFGTKLAKTLGLETVNGISVSPIITTLVLIAIFFFCGLLVEFAKIGRFRTWLENAFLKYIPGYVKYKVKMEEKLLPPDDTRIPVFVQLNNAWKPGFLIEKHEGRSVVFMPHTPETDTGDIWLIDDEKIQPAQMDARKFKKALELSGYGLIIQRPEVKP